MTETQANEQAARTLLASGPRQETRATLIGRIKAQIAAKYWQDRVDASFERDDIAVLLGDGCETCGGSVLGGVCVTGCGRL